MDGMDPMDRMDDARGTDRFDETRTPDRAPEGGPGAPGDPPRPPGKGVVVAEPLERERVRLAPLWYVILHDDQLHTYDYVIEMLCKLFSMTPTRAFVHALEVDSQGVTIVARLPKREAADKRDQIASYGGDPRMNTTVSMKASIEPCDD